MWQFYNIAALLCCDAALLQRCKIGVLEQCSSLVFSYGIAGLLQYSSTVRECRDIAVREHYNIAA